MPADTTPRRPRTVDGYLRLMARTILAAGLAWSTVEALWPALNAAFEGFSARKVAAFRPADIERILQEPGVLQNRKKVEAVVAAARLLCEARDRHGSVTAWLQSFPTGQERVRALRRAPYVGRFGAFYVLSVVGFEVPEECRFQSKGGPAGPLRTTALQTVS